jgi:hypothetical protein
LSALVGAAVVEDARTEVALIFDDERVSTQVFAPVDGRFVLVKLETCDAVIGTETGFARSHTWLT